MDIGLGHAPGPGVWPRTPAAAVGLQAIVPRAPAWRGLFPGRPQQGFGGHSGSWALESVAHVAWELRRQETPVCQTAGRLRFSTSNDEESVMRPSKVTSRAFVTVSLLRGREGELFLCLVSCILESVCQT